MKSHGIISLLLPLGLVTLLATGCTWDRRNTTGAAVGGISGAALGAGIASATGGSAGTGALIGLGAGILAGATVAEITKDDEPPRHRHYSAPPPPPPQSANRARAREHFEIAMRAKDWNESHYNLERAIALDPTEPAYYNNMGVLYYQSGDRARAEWYYRQALRFDQNYEPAHQNLRQLGN